MNKLRYFRIFGILLIVIISYIFLSFYFQGEDLKFSKTSISYYEHEWEVIIDGQNTQQINLPNEIEINANQTYQLETKLPQDFLSRQTLLFRSSLQFLKVYLDDELIYENLDQSLQTPPVTSMWNIIELPENANNKRLTLEIVSPYQVMASQINGLYFGDLGSIYLFIFLNHGYIFIFSIMIILLSFSLLSLPALFQTQISRQTQLLSLFTLLLGLWMLAESRMMQFLIASQFIHAALAYLMLASFTIPLLIYVKDYVLIKNRVSLNALIGVHLVNFTYVLIAQITGFATFFETVQTTTYLHIVTIITMLSFLTIEVLVLKSKPAIDFLKVISVILIAGLAEFANFFLKNYTNTSSFLVFGLAVFLIVQIINYLKVVNNIIHQSKMAKEFEKLATIDTLTKAKNRMVFDSDVLQLLSDESQKTIRVSFFDVNNLKIINDTLGHAMGDDAIVKTYELINETFNDIGETYRVGGDEFACIILSENQDMYDKKVAELHKRIKELQPTIPYALKIANGSALYDPKVKESFSDVLSRADKQMYQNKQNQKTS